MGNAKRRGTYEERKAEAEFRNSLDKQKLDAWYAEVEEFRKTFGLDVGIISGSPPEEKIVVVRLGALRSRLLGITEAPKPEGEAN